jgi:hypothetical protein
MARETAYGIEQVIPLNAPLNSSTVSQDIFPIDKGGPSQANNGINRDGGISELYESNTTLGTGQYGYVSSNGISLVIDTLAGNVYSPNPSSTLSSPLNPSNTLYPSDSLYPSGGYGNVLDIGRLNGSTPIFFNKYQVPPMYLDCVVASSPTAGITTSTGYTLLGIHLGSNSTFILDEFDPVTMKIYNTVTITCANTFNRTGVGIARANILTWASVQSTSGFIYNVGNIVYYHISTHDYNTTKNSDILQQNFNCYFQPTATGTGILLFSTTYQGQSAIWHNSSSAINTWTEIRDPGSQTHGCTMGDFGTYTLSTANNTVGLTLGVTAWSGTITATVPGAAAVTVPAFWINVTYAAAGTISSVTGYGLIGTGAAGSYTGGGLYNGASAEVQFIMRSGICTPYGCCGTFMDASNLHFGNFHGSISQENIIPTIEPKAFPQLDVIHKMLIVRSYNGSISLLCGNATGMGDSDDCGNLINDFAGGTFGYDIMAGNPFDGTAQNYFFYPLSWRGTTSNTGVTIYKLNNGQFVSVCTTSVPKFSEISSGVVTLNTLSAWGAIIDLNSQVLHYNYSGYIPSFFCDNSNTGDVHSVQYLKIFDTYSSSLDEGQVYSDYSYVAPMAMDVNGGKTIPIGWTAWNGQTMNYIGNYISCTLGSSSILAVSAQSQGAYVYNANVPPGGDASFVGGGINMLNAVAIQSIGYFGYYLFPSGGGSNLLAWKSANIFIIHGIFYACNGEYIYQITLTNGTTGVVQGSPSRVAYAIGMNYLCASPRQAYFYSSFDNSIFTFNGGQSLNKAIQFNQKDTIKSAVYVVRDNALYIQTSNSIIVLREEQERFVSEISLNGDSFQLTENTLPPIFNSYSNSYLKSTSNGIYFLCGTNYATWQYSSGGTVIPLTYQSAYMSPGEFQTVQIQRITGQILCTQKQIASIQLTLNYLLPDGTSGTVMDIQATTVLNAQGYYRFSWVPNIQSYFMAISIGVTHLGIEQKVDLLELLVYYKPDAEVIPLNQVKA